MTARSREPKSSRPQPEAIADRLRSARELKGWSREALAYHSGVSWAAIAQIESGRRTDVRQSTLGALAAALGVTVDQLMGREPTSPPLEHRALVYRTPAEFLRVAAPFLAEGIARGEGALAVTSRDRITALRDELGSASGAVTFIASDTWYRDPHTTLAGFRQRINEKLEAGHAWVRAIGEPLWLGRSKKEVRRWILYESILNLTLATSRATIICPYDASSLPEPVVAAARRTHPEMHGVRGRNTKYRDPAELLLSNEEDLS